jgi:eukaryotic-like serine/threonine-protein kinase
VSSHEVGETLDGKYEIVRRLGSGGMGEVHLVRHLHLQELRVVKILRQDLAADPSAQARFLREARLATQIKHPNVAILYDFSRLQDGSFYMVWEHIEGQDVGEIVRERGPFPVALAIQLAIQALRGMEAIHATGVIHRDVSPDNLMITTDRRGQHRVKIIDLGLAKNLEIGGGGGAPNFEITQVGMFMGKLQYCSPEQAGTVSGETLDRRSDIYSFGLVLYEMLVGLPPFDSETQHGFIFKRLSEDPLPLVGRNPKVEIPAELDRVVRRALERDRERRYPDALTFIEALERVGKALSAAETQEVAIPPGSGTSGAAVAAPAPPSRPAAAVQPPVQPAPPARQRSSSELSREERLDLLAQIERAGKRAQEGSQVLSRAELALAAGRVAEARQLAVELEAANPRAAGLEALKRKLADLAAAQDRERRAAEAEAVLAGYLEKRQLPLARLALETLLELAPEHPKRAHYEAALAALARETEGGKRVERSLAAGRKAVAERDFRAARRELEAIAKADPKRAEAFRAEIVAAERAERRGADSDDRRRRFEEHLAAGRISDAEGELAALALLDLPRVTLDSLQSRLAEARAAAQEGESSAEFERRYRVVLDHGDWFGAREVAMEFERAIPRSPRPAEMFAEVAHRESQEQRRRAVEQGVAQVEAFLAKGEARNAELALKVLVQMDPENRHRRRLERQVRGLARG